MTVGQTRQERPGDRRRSRHGHGRAGPGQNVLVAFMPWGGYNFEDSILISERLVKEDALHLDPHRGVRDCGPGHQAGQGGDHPRHPQRGRGRPEGPGRERDHPDRCGGEARATSWSGKITPKGETQLSPEEKLLRAIFGEKAGDVRDTSLRVPPGVEGTVIDARVFSRKGVEKDERAAGHRGRGDRADPARTRRTRSGSSRESAVQEAARAADREEGGGQAEGRAEGDRAPEEGRTDHGGGPRRDPHGALEGDRCPSTASGMEAKIERDPGLHRASRWTS